MATITQLASAATGGATSLTFTGVTFQPKDALVLIVATYATSPSTTPSCSNGEPIGYVSGRTNTGSSPDLSSIYFDNTGVATSLTGGTLTWTISPSSEAVGVLWRIRPEVGSIIVRRSTVATTTSGTTGSITTSSSAPATPGAIIVGGGGVADNTYFVDTDTTRGSWSSVFQITNTTNDDIGAFSQTKITSGGTGTQTYNGTWDNSGNEDACLFASIYYEIALPYWGINAL
jgi:hypothetical protein